MTTIVNPYLYSQNNPVSNADPHGLLLWHYDSCNWPSQDQVCGCWNLEYGHVYYGAIKDGPTCYCYKHDYIDSLTFHEFWVFGYSPVYWALHLKFGDIGINFGNQICNINFSTLPERIMTKPDVCCHILAHCDRCSEQDEEKELAFISAAFINVVQQHGKNGGGICSWWDWANNYPLKGLFHNLLSAGYMIGYALEHQSTPCGCQDWQDTVYQKIDNTLTAIDSKCWRVCRTDWSLFGILPIHHWVTLESRSGITRYSLDPWGGGNKLHKAFLYELDYEFWGSLKKGECSAPGIWWPPGSLW